MTTQQLENFLNIVAYGTFNRAARTRFISESTVSRSITALEQELNVKLFNRGSRSVTLTKAGLVFQKSAIEILHRLDAFEMANKAAHCLIEAKADVYFNIACSPYSNIYTALIRYLDKFPCLWTAMQYRIKLLGTSIISKMLDEGLVQVGVICNADLSSLSGGFGSRSLCYFPPEIIVSKKNPFFERASIDIDELLDICKTWDWFLYTNNFSNIMSGREFQGEKDFLIAHQQTGKHLPTRLVIAWAEEPDDRIIIPSGEFPIPLGSKLRSVLVKGLDPSCFSHSLVWKRENETQPMLAQFLENIN